MQYHGPVVLVVKVFNSDNVYLCMILQIFHLKCERTEFLRMLDKALKENIHHSVLHAHFANL